MYKKKIEFMNAMPSTPNHMILNKNQGTVTIPFLDFFKLLYDSATLCVVMHVHHEDINETLRIMREEDALLGEAFTTCQLPMSDIETMGYVYGVPVEQIEKFMKGELNG